nr:helix-turn-helix transcriptional regulator [uncultured Agathobaculum sp.]
MTQTHSRLSTIMGEKRLKISTISRDTGISRATLTSLYYDRNSAVSLQTLGTLCAYLGCEVGDLISYTSQKEESP